MPKRKLTKEGTPFIDNILENLCDFLDTTFEKLFSEKVKKEEEGRKKQVQGMLADLGKKLRILRKGSGVHIKEAAKRAGIATSTASYYESGKVLPSERYIFTIFSLASEDFSKNGDIAKTFFEIMRLKKKIEETKTLGGVNA